MFACNHDAFKNLQSLFGLGFLNPHVNTDGIAWLKLRNVLTQLRLFNIVQSIHFSMLLKSSLYSFSKSGRLRLVFSIAASLRQRSISAWFPLNKTSGTFIPRNSGGRVYCGWSNKLSENDSNTAEVSLPNAPGNNRTTASTTTIAAGSPPDKT